jgi:hypothetical protein
MTEPTRELDIVILDDLSPELLNGVVGFFNREFPNPSGLLMTPDFFLTKIAPQGAAIPGYLTVAAHRGVVVGCTSAVVKHFRIEDQEIKVIEIGDTFTSNNFRRNCYFKSLYPGTSSNDDYLNKSIFGRLVSETIDRARKDGAIYVYGTPNTQSKLPYIGRLNFKLVDDGFTSRISSPSISHKRFHSSVYLRSIVKMYLRVTLVFSILKTFRYRLNLVKKDAYVPISGLISNIQFKGSLTIANSDAWVRARFLLNSDKDYKVVQVVGRFTKKIHGYMFFLEKVGADDFSLLILSKTIVATKKILKLTLPLSRRAAHKYFIYNNLSIWIDNRITSPSIRYLYGFPSAITQVEIVGKDLQEQNLGKVNFYNFHYGDSDLG